MKTVPCFGVHKDSDGVNHLFQGHKVTNAIGLPGNGGMRVALSDKLCNHSMEITKVSRFPALQDLDSWIKRNKDLAFWKESLLRLMLPVPREVTETKIYYVSESEAELNRVCRYANMSSPIMPIVQPVWAYQSRKDIYDALNLTNIQPLVLTGVRSDSMGLMRDMAVSAANTPRRLIFMGQPDMIIPPNMQRVQPTLWDYPKDIDWPALGNAYLARWMREQ